MGSSMRISKQKYLEKCQEALAKAEAQEKERLDNKARFESQILAWAQKALADGMVVAKYSDYSTLGVEFSVKPEAYESKPDRPLDFSRYQNNNQIKIDDLKEVIALIEMTESETIGISVANKVSRYL